MRVTAKGQVTIPQDIREQVGIQPGSEVRFEIDDDAVRLIKTGDSPRGHALVGRLRGSGHGRMSTDEIMSLTRE